MTRLESSHLAGLGQGLEDYDRELEARVGRSLRQIACKAAEIEEGPFVEATRDIRVGVVSTTIGKGILTGFAEAVRDIVQHLGCEAFVPESTDVAGLAAAIDEGSSVVFLADDSCFIAINLSAGAAVDNGEATGRGYAAALEGWVDALQDRQVLVIGAGRVGRGAAKALMGTGVRLGVFDRDRSRAKELVREVNGIFEEDLERALQNYTIVVDATPAAGIIEAKHIRPDTVIAAPGIPLGLSPEARTRIEERVIHDPLQIGVATMMVLAVKFTIGHAD